MNHDITNAPQLTMGSEPQEQTGYDLEAVSKPLWRTSCATPLLTPSAHSSTLALASL